MSSTELRAALSCGNHLKSLLERTPVPSDPKRAALHQQMLTQAEAVIGASRRELSAITKGGIDALSSNHLPVQTSNDRKER
jgi:hypothetical protein